MTEKEFRQKERSNGAKKSVKKRKKKNRIKALLTVLILIALLLVAAISVVAYNIFKIESIIVEGNSVYTAEQIINESELEAGDSLLLLSEKKLSERLEKELPYISGVTIRRELPTSLVITVSETYEEQAFYRDSKFYSANKNGKILNEYFERPEDLAVTIAGLEDGLEKGFNYTCADELQSNLQDEIAKFAEEKKIKVTLVNATDIYRAYFIIEDRLLVLLGSSTYLDRKLEFLPKTLQSMAEDSRNVIDLSNWTPDNNEAISYEKDINEYFVFK